MQIRDCLAEIQAYCAQNANPALIQKYAKFFTEGYDAYGVDFKQLDTQRKQWLKEWTPALGLEGFLQLGDLLIDSGKYEEASFAISFIAAQKDHFTPATLEHIGGWLETDIQNWAHTDALAGDALPHFLLKRIVPLEAFSSWRTSPGKWKRRAVPVTMLYASKAGIPLGDQLAFIEPLMTDKEKPVQQGLGWYLRDTWKGNPEPVESFLLAWKDVCGRTIVQYATEKMTAEQKARFKKSGKGA